MKNSGTGWERTLGGLPKRTTGVGKNSLMRKQVSLARELIGYEPSVDFREGLKRTIAWYRDRFEAGGTYLDRAGT